jgi:hypothetical protein
MARVESVVKRKLHEIDLDPGQARIFGEAIRAYAHAAYPDGGSECAQVSRSALLDTADLCRHHDGGPLRLRRRQLPLLRAAVRWVSGSEGPTSIHLPPDFESLLG